MRKNIKYLILAGLLFFNLSLAAVWNYSGAQTVNDIWNAGDVINFTASTTFTGSTIQTGTPGAMNIVMAAGAVVQFNTSTLDLRGTSASQVLIWRNGGAGIHGGFRFNAGTTAYLEYVTMQNSSFAFRIYNTSNVMLNNILISSPTLSPAIDLQGNVSPSLINCRILNPASYPIQTDLAGSASPVFPVISNCYIEKGAAAAHVNITGANSVPGGTIASFECNEWSGGAPVLTQTPPVAGITIDSLPTNTGYASAKKIIQANTGSINGPVYFAPNSTGHEITGADLTLANGANVRIGYNSVANTYIGGVNLAIGNNLNISVANGAALRSGGSAGNNNTFTRSTGSNWGSLILNAGCTATVASINFQYANTAIIDRSAATIQDLTFSAANPNTNCISVNTTAGGTYIRNTFNGSFLAFGYGIDTAVNCTISGNTFNAAAYTPIRITGGAPDIKANNVNYGLAEPALVIIGGTFAVGNIVSNNFIGAGTSVIVSSNGGPNPVYLRNNSWGANPPADARFSGTDFIIYEPWLSAAYPAGVLTFSKPVTASGEIPVSGSTITVIPSGVTFNISDVGYHNGTPLRMRLRVSTSNVFATTIFDNSPGTAYLYAPAQTVYQAVPGMAFGNTYYWQAWADNQYDPGWSPTPNPYFWFLIDQPRVDLVLTSDKAAANAGDTVTYTIDFTNNSAFAVGNTIITGILPDDVYFNGTMRLENLDATMGTITLTAWANIDGTGAQGTINSGGPVVGTWAPAAGWTPNNHLVRRIDVQITALSVGDNGLVRYQTIVK